MSDNPIQVLDYSLGNDELYPWRTTRSKCVANMRMSVCDGARPHQFLEVESGAQTLLSINKKNIVGRARRHKNCISVGPRLHTNYVLSLNVSSLHI